MSARQNNKCMQCGTDGMKGARENFRYDISGLDGITLEDVMVYRCSSCGEYEVSLPRIQDLHATLAREIATKKERLGPKELRFLRTYLGYSSADFARRIGVSIPTVSRWESEEDPLGMKPAVEKLVRLMVLMEEAVKEYPLEEMATGEPVTSRLRLHATKRGWSRQTA